MTAPVNSNANNAYSIRVENRKKPSQTPKSRPIPFDGNQPIMGSPSPGSKPKLPFNPEDITGIFNSKDSDKFRELIIKAKCKPPGDPGEWPIRIRKPEDNELSELLRKKRVPVESGE
jgi:hypothetical protein